jgi:drug/metabolite transporter (DMT)-like permease
MGDGQVENAARAANRGTLVGSAAILIWSTLALLTALSGPLPPFQMVAMAFSVAALVGFLYVLLQGKDGWRRLRQPLPVWAVGVGGLFGYHFLYFLAFGNAPAVEVNLLNYLWPVLIVLFSGLLPGERLRWWHVAGAMLAFTGVGLLLSGGGRLEFDLRFWPGYLAAAGAAVVWAGYSVLNRRLGRVPTEIVAGLCAATALLAALSHLVFEQTQWPEGSQWGAVLGLGLGPVGLAFYFWDYGVKWGEIRTLGVLSYAIPLLSTALLVMAGRGESNGILWIACGLIVVGGVLASREQVWPRGKGV